MSKTTKTIAQWRDLTDSELVDQIAETRDQLFRLHLGKHTNQVTSSAELANKRKAIARMQTILNGRKNGVETQAQKKA